MAKIGWQGKNYSHCLPAKEWKSDGTGMWKVTWAVVKVWSILPQEIVDAHHMFKRKLH